MSSPSALDWHATLVQARHTLAHAHYDAGTYLSRLELLLDMPAATATRAPALRLDALVACALARPCAHAHAALKSVLLLIVIQSHEHQRASVSRLPATLPAPVAKVRARAAVATASHACVRRDDRQRPPHALSRDARALLLLLLLLGALVACLLVHWQTPPSPSRICLELPVWR